MDQRPVVVLMVAAALVAAIVMSPPPPPRGESLLASLTEGRDRELASSPPSDVNDQQPQADTVEVPPAASPVTDAAAVPVDDGTSPAAPVVAAAPGASLKGPAPPQRVSPSPDEPKRSAARRRPDTSTRPSPRLLPPPSVRESGALPAIPMLPETVASLTETLAAHARPRQRDTGVVYTPPRLDGCRIEWVVHGSAGGGYTVRSVLSEIKADQTTVTEGDGGWIVELPWSDDGSIAVKEEVFSGFVVWFGSRDAAENAAAAFRRAAGLCTLQREAHARSNSSSGADGP